MKTNLLTSLHALCLGTGTLLVSANAAEPPPLWQIGQVDRSNAELAFAPAGYGKLEHDALFVVGESDPKRDWPYAHPGPQDAWGGNRSHTFAVLFGLQALPAEGDCHLQVDLLDTHSMGPPKFRVEINGKPFEQELPRGAGDASIQGEPAKGRPHNFTVTFPSSLLRRGDNQVTLATVTGSWLLYDALALRVPAGAELTAPQVRTIVERTQPVRALAVREGGEWQPVLVALRQFGGSGSATLRLADGPTLTTNLPPGLTTVELLTPAVSSESQRQLAIRVGGQELPPRELTLKPVRKRTVYILPHSHTDIGYTDLQTVIEQKQVQNLVDGIAAAKRTADYPEGARFVWNVEVLWAADLYLKRLSDEQKADFLDAVKRGQVVLNGMYLNELTGLCRPEELLRLFRFSTEMAELTGRPIDAVMISDVPGYTWGTVTAMNQAGIKYFSTAPNYFDRIGTILRDWEEKPFYWVGPDGKSQVMVMIPWMGYALSHVVKQLTPKFVEDYQAQLDKAGYPYDIAHMRWSGTEGDNAKPDPAICEFVKEWNTRYAWPKFIISGTSEAFRAFEERYGAQLPKVRGDWTPYWEDGAGSSALETAMNRATSDRLTQAGAIFALRWPWSYPVEGFEAAWNHTLLYSEHTWGAHCSVWGPERQETVEQWAIKRSYAEQADQQSRALLHQGLNRITFREPVQPPAGMPGAVDIFNSLSWPRTELVTVSAELSAAGDRVTDAAGRPVASQRLRSGELVFLATDLPALAGRRYTISTGAPHVGARATATGSTLDNGLVRAVVEPTTGGIVGLTARGLEGNFADTQGGESLNDFRYFNGADPTTAQRNGPVKISVGEPGPLVASLIVESDAPGCNALRREYRVVAGLDHVELLNLVDKARLVAASYKKPEGKESLNFAFPFQVPDGDLLLDLPLGAMRPEADQMPSACKNWFTIGRWADVSNADRGITWVTLDAPLLQVGALTANLLESQSNPDAWRNRVDRTQTIYSWAMNNHWGTNYRAYQEGPTWFRFLLRPHLGTTPDAATRFATGFSQPLLATARDRRAALRHTAGQHRAARRARLGREAERRPPGHDAPALWRLRQIRASPPQLGERAETSLAQRHQRETAPTRPRHHQRSGVGSGDRAGGKTMSSGCMSQMKANPPDVGAHSSASTSLVVPRFGQ
jgi:alpha-mannosidase